MTHETCWELLPWLANGRLDDDLQPSVSTHLEACGACRAELQFIRGIQEVVQAAPDEDDSRPSSAVGFQRVLSEIESSDGARTPRASTSSRVLWWAAAAVLVLAAIAGWQRPGPYRTLSAQEQATVSGPHLRVVFDAETSTEVLREVLGSVRGRIVDGPSSVGAYVVELPAEADFTSSMEALRAHPSTKLVEPIGD